MQAEQARASLNNARALLSTLKSDHDVARTACLEAREKTGFSLDFNASDRKVEGLISWFDRLSAASSASTPAALLVGLANWMTAAQQILAADRAGLNEAKQLISMRLELRGRLEAFKAKARAHALSEEDELVALADQATALLYRRPTPMDEAAALVAAYEAKLNSRTRKVV